MNTNKARRSMRVPQSRDELIRHLREQMVFLRASSMAYDEGDVIEAKRLAVAIRVLVHDTRNSVSLLSSLSIKQALKYYDKYAGLPEAPRRRVFYGVGIQPTPSGIRYVASLNEPKETSQFEKWWNGIAIQEQELRYSRSDIVRALADMDGGAHVDPALDATYAQMSRRFGEKWTMISRDGKSGPGVVDHGPEFAVVRQCANELELTIVRQAPRLLGVESIT